MTTTEKFRYSVIMYRYTSRHITGGETELICRWDGLRLDQAANRWGWYFRYRAALEQIRTPHHHVELKTVRVQVVSDEEAAAAARQRRITALRGLITKAEGHIRRTSLAWNSLFPMEQDEHYLKYVAKLNRLRAELAELEGGSAV